MADDRPLRLFAQLRAGAVECPACGWMNQFSPGKAYHQKKPRPGTTGHLLDRKLTHNRRSTWRAGSPRWNPITQRLRCQGCQKIYRVGIWVQEVGRAVWSRPAPDTVPDPRQLARLRHEAGGLWAPTKARSSDEPINQILEADEDDGEES